MEGAFGIYVIESFIAAGYCYHWAVRKGLNKYVWSFYGLTIPVVALIHILYRTHGKEWMPPHGF